MRPIDELMQDYFDDLLDDAGLDDLQAWLRSSTQHRQLFLRESAMRHEMRQVLALGTLAQQDAPTRRVSSIWLKPVIRRWRWGLAAALVCAVSLGFSALIHARAQGTAEVVACDGIVWAEAGSVRRFLHPGDRIAAGETITTDEEAEVVLRLGDGSRFTLGSGGAFRQGTMDAQTWFLDQGHLDAEVVHQQAGRNCLLRTPAADLIVVGTIFDCAVHAGVTHLHLVEGRVRMRAANGTEVACSTGETAVADRGGARLLVPPALPEVPLPPSAPVVAPHAASAFAGASGFGAGALGGRGGQLLAVTTLADDGPGSLREAVAVREPRIIVFRVSGTIALRSPLRILDGRVTIAGQTAPGDGICLRDGSVEIGGYDHRSHAVHSCDDVVIRHLRLRPGDLAGPDRSGLRANGLSIIAGNRIIIDHCSISWTGNKAIRSGLVDEPLGSVRNLTIQDCLIAETLHASGSSQAGSADDPASGFAVLLGGTDVSMLRNVIAHVFTYAPKPCGTGVFDFRNNLVYDCAHRDYGYINDADAGLRLNYIGNLIKAGPSTPRSFLAFRSLQGSADLCIRDLWVVRSDGTGDATIPNWVQSTTGQRFTAREYPVPAEPLLPANALCDLLLPGVGASRPHRDAVDNRICGEVRNGTGRGISTMRGQRQWPVLHSDPVPIDSDGDGLPDDWERAHGLDPHDPHDAGRRDEHGLSAFDRYLDELAAPE